MVTDTISDLLTRIRNAQMARHRAVRLPVCKMSRWILDVLKTEELIGGVAEKEDQAGKFAEYEVDLKYLSTGEPLISELKRVSKPGRRIFKGVDELSKVHCGLGVLIISTSQGVMTDREARKRRIGGEVLAYIS